MLSSQRTKLISRIPFKFKNLPNKFSSFSCLLDFCNKIEFLQQIHARFVVYGLHQNPTLCSKLINSYANLGHLHLCKKIFTSVNDPNSLLYNTILKNLFKFGNFDDALLLYQDMVNKSMYPDELSYYFVLKSCTHVGNLRKIHGHIVKLGYDLDVSVSNALEEMYRVFEDDGNAQNVFEEMPTKNSRYWNSLISECSQNNEPEETFEIFRKMIKEGLEPDSSTVISLLRSCVILNSVRLGRYIHLLIVLYNLSKDLSVNTALLTMYIKLGKLDTAKLLFEKMPIRDCVVWNIMILAYSRNGDPGEALTLLMKMIRSGVRSDLFTGLAAISSAAELKSFERGRQIHAHVIRSGSDYQVSVHNSLIEMYSRCGNVNIARKIFDFLLDKTVVSWSSIIKGYVNNDRCDDALSLFFKMKIDGVKLDSATVINVLPACVNQGALEHVKFLHLYSMKTGLISVVSVVTSLLDSYAKCGCIEMAQKLFDEEEVDVKDTISWNSMIGAYSKHGNWQRCIELYNRMKDSKLRPDKITFLGLLTACVNSGLVKEGWASFVEMTETYNFLPDQEHYACMVDLLGRTGHVNDAQELIKSMPFEPDARVWGPLLSACKKGSDTKLAEFAAKKLISMEPKNAGNYVLLSNIYASAGKWDEVAKMRVVLRDRGLRKTPGCSWLEINGRVHEFRVADRSHPKWEDIYTILGSLELDIKMNKSKNSQSLS